MVANVLHSLSAVSTEQELGGHPGSMHVQPKEIVTFLVPSWSTLVFLEVSPVCFHQVSEVFSENKTLLSISS